MTRGSQSGFTLIEALAALGIAGLVSVLLLGSLGFSGGAWTRSVAISDASSDIYSAQSVLRRLTFNFSNGTGRARFAGNAESLAFTTRFAAPGEAPAATEAGLVLATCETKPCLALTLTRAAAGPANANPPLIVRTPLIRAIAGVHLSYLGAPADGWRDTWREEDGAPRLVRVEVKFAAHDPRRWPALYLPLGAS